MNESGITGRLLKVAPALGRLDVWRSGAGGHSAFHLDGWRFRLRRGRRRHGSAHSWPHHDCQGLWQGLLGRRNCRWARLSPATISAVHRADPLWLCRQCLDWPAVPGRHHSWHPDDGGPDAHHLSHCQEAEICSRRQQETDGQGAGRRLLGCQMGAAVSRGLGAGHPGRPLYAFRGRLRRRSLCPRHWVFSPIAS